MYYLGDEQETHQQLPTAITKLTFTLRCLVHKFEIRLQTPLTVTLQITVPYLLTEQSATFHSTICLSSQLNKLEPLLQATWFTAELCPLSSWLTMLPLVTLYNSKLPETVPSAKVSVSDPCSSDFRFFLFRGDTYQAKCHWLLLI